MLQSSFRAMPPKIGLTMRQPGRGKLEWIQDEKKRAKTMADKLAKTAAKGEKSKEKKEKKK